MVKIKVASIASFLMLLIASGVACIFKGVDMPSNELLIVAFVILGVSLLIVLIFRKHASACIITLFFNAIALGIIIRAWYIFRGFDNSMWRMLLVCALCVAYLWLYGALSFIPACRNHKILFTIIFVALSAAVYGVLVFSTVTTWLSTFGFYMIVEMAFILGICLKASNATQLLHNVALASFSAVVVVLTIVICIAAEDAPDFALDLLDGGAPFYREDGKKMAVDVTGRKRKIR